MRERILPNLRRPSVIWNKLPGALQIDSAYSNSPYRFPFYTSYLQADRKFTALILAVSPVNRVSDPLFKLIQTINLSEFVDQVGKPL